jgi:hypothetical protein
MAPPNGIRFASPQCGNLLRILRLSRFSVVRVSATAVGLLAGMLLLGFLISGCAGTASANSDDKPPSSAEYYELAELLSETYWKVGSLPKHRPQEEMVDRFDLDKTDPHQHETIDRFKALCQSRNALVSRLAEQGLKSFFTWKFWQGKLANQGFQASDLDAAQKEWAQAATIMGIKGLDAKAFGGEFEIAQGGLESLDNIIKKMSQKFAIDGLRAGQYARYQRAKRKIWENDLLRFAAVHAGPACPKPAFNFYESRSRTDNYDCLLAENLSKQDLTHCTVEVTIDCDHGLKDHSVYYLPSWHNRDVLLLQEDMEWWKPPAFESIGVLRVDYSVWADELRETQQTLLTDTTFARKPNPRSPGPDGIPLADLWIPHVKVRRLSPSDVKELAQSRAALVAAITHKSYIPEFKAGKKRFRGRIHFDGIIPVSESGGKPRKEVAIRLDDSRWTVGRTLRRVDLDVDLGHSIELGVYQGGVDTEPPETSYRTSDLVFLRHGELYLRTDKVYETKRQIGKPVLLRPVD